MKIKRVDTGYTDYISPETECITVDAESVLCSSCSSTNDLLYDEEWGELFNS